MQCFLIRLCDLWCFRAGRRVSKLTHGRMLTTASIRSLTASDSCSKLHDLKLWQLPRSSLNSRCLFLSHFLSFIRLTLSWCRTLVLNTLDYPLSVPLSNTCCVFLICAPVRKSCQHPVRLKRRYQLYKVQILALHALHFRTFTFAVDYMHVRLSSPQQKQQEIERVEKWLKMVKNWDKYRHSEKVCN